MILTVWLVGAWITTSIMAAQATLGRYESHASKFMTVAVVLVVSGSWPLAWLVTFGIVIRKAMLAAREKAVEAGKKKIDA